MAAPQKSHKRDLRPSCGEEITERNGRSVNELLLMPAFVLGFGLGERGNRDPQGWAGLDRHRRCIMGGLISPRSDAHISPFLLRPSRAEVASGMEDRRPLYTPSKANERSRDRIVIAVVGDIDARCTRPVESHTDW